MRTFLIIIISISLPFFFIYSCDYRNLDSKLKEQAIEDAKAASPARSILNIYNVML